MPRKKRAIKAEPEEITSEQVQISIKFVPTELAKRSHRYLLNEHRAWVSIGGQTIVTRKVKENKVKHIIPAADQKDLEYFYNLGLTTLVEKIEVNDSTD